MKTEECTGESQWIERRKQYKNSAGGMNSYVEPTLQQRWKITEFAEGSATPIGVTTEWRDVPTVKEP
jgi:hypothetical protein